MEKKGCFTFTLHNSNPVIFSCYNTILSKHYTHRLVGMNSFHIIQILKTQDITSDDLYACIQRTAPTALQPQKHVSYTILDV